MSNKLPQWDRIRQKGWLWYHAFKFDNNFWLQWTFLSLIYLSCIINIYIFNFLKNLISIPQNLANEVITKLLAIWCLRLSLQFQQFSTDNLRILNWIAQTRWGIAFLDVCSFSLELASFLRNHCSRWSLFDEVGLQERVMTCLFSPAQFMRSVDGNQCDEW